MTSNIDTDSAPTDVAICACSNCNTAHRKCDRKLPICGGCLRKKKTDCTYEYIPAKRLRRQMEKQRQQPYPATPVSQFTEERGETTPSPIKLENAQFRIPTLSQLDMQIEKTQDVHFGSNSILPPINISTITFTPPTQLPPEKQPIKNATSPVPTRKSPVEQTVPSNNNTTSSLEKYFEHLYLSSPLTDLSKAQAILAYRRKIVNENDISLITSLMSSRDDVALIFAMQAYYYKRFDVLNLSQRCFDISKNFVSTSFDTVLTSFSMASAFSFLGLCLLDENEIDRASFYFSTVDTYLNKLESKPKVSESPIEEAMQNLRLRYLRMQNFSANYYCSGDTNLKVTIKCQVALHFLNKQFRKVKAMLDRQVGQNIQDGDIDEFMPYADMILNDVTKGTDLFQLDVSMIDLLCKKIKHTFDAPSERGLETDIRTKRLGFLMLAQGYKIQCLRERMELYGHSADIEQAIRQIADLITALTTTGVYNFCTYITAQPVAIALSVHISCLAKATRPMERAQLVELIKVGSRSLTVLSARFKLIMTKYGPLIHEGESAIKVHDDHQQLLQMCTTLQSGALKRPTAPPNIPNASPDPSSMLVNLLDAAPITPMYGEQIVTNTEFESFLGDFLNDTDSISSSSLSDGREDDFLFL